MTDLDLDQPVLPGTDWFAAFVVTCSALERVVTITERPLGQPSAYPCLFKAVGGMRNWRNGVARPDLSPFQTALREWGEEVGIWFPFCIASSRLVSRQRAVHHERFFFHADFPKLPPILERIHEGAFEKKRRVIDILPNGARKMSIIQVHVHSFGEMRARLVANEILEGHRVAFERSLGISSGLELKNSRHASI